MGDLNQDGRTDIADVAFLLALSSYSGSADDLAFVIENGNATPVTPAEIEERLGDVDYYTLDGVKVGEPAAPGIYVVKQSGVTKMIILKR